MPLERDVPILPRHADECGLKRTPTFVDLFCGCGGLSLGFTNAGLECVYAVDLNASAIETHKANIPGEAWCGRIQDFVGLLESGEIAIPDVDVVIGGPPCQSFSPLGRMNPNQVRREVHAVMDELWTYFMRVVELLQPEVIVTENVPEFLTSQQFTLYQEMAKRLDYWPMDHGVLSADLYGVPQKRRRGICIAARNVIAKLPPTTGERMSVRQALRGIPLVPNGKNWHIGRNPTEKSLERYRTIPPGGNRYDLMRLRPDITPDCWLRKLSGTTDVFGRMKWDEPSCTIRTEFYKPEKGRYLHPSEHRPITHREAAAIQSFPKDYDFRGSKIEVARQIGEAVPPKLGYEIARAVLAALCEVERK